MLTPEQFNSTAVYDLLIAAAEGKVGTDQRWVHAIVDRGEQAVPDMVRFGTEPRPDDVIDLTDELILMFRHLQSPAAVPFFVEFLREGGDIPDEFTDAVYPIREAALEPLIQLAGELEEEDAGEVAFTLASFRTQDERVLRILTDRLEYDLTGAAIDLSLNGNPAARPALERALAEVDQDEHLKNLIQQALDDIERNVDEDASPSFDLFEYFPEKSGPDTSVLREEELLELMESSDPEYRFSAVAGFINRDISEEARAKLLNRAGTDDDVRVRAKSWEAFSSIVADDKELFEAMLSTLENTAASKIERAGALVGLGQRANEEPIRKYAEEFYEDPETRAAALSAMWNSLDRSFAKYFPPHLEDSDPDIRKQAISGVGYLGIYESAEKLRKYFEDDEYRANALFAYALAARAEISPARIRALFRRIEDFAHGFTEEEEELVEIALDERLMLHGHSPVFHADEERHPHHEHGAEDEHAPATAEKVGRNDPCPCGSGKKFKKCCGQ
jgi:HEAT repeat protein